MIPLVLKSKSTIDWGINTEKISDREYLIQGNQTGNRFDYQIEPDASAASYFYAAAAISGGTVTTPGLGTKSLQGDIKFAQALQLMGAKIIQNDNSTTVTGSELHGIDIDMNAISDTAQTLATVAVFADSPTTIRNVGHMRHKETDRITAVVTELNRAGVRAEEFEDGLRIFPGTPMPADIHTYDDHRMAMCFSLATFGQARVRIMDPSCVSKTFPTYFDVFRGLLR